jgi:hypothetical protein
VTMTRLPRGEKPPYRPDAAVSTICTSKRPTHAWPQGEKEQSRQHQSHHRLEQR